MSPTAAESAQELAKISRASVQVVEALASQQTAAKMARRCKTSRSQYNNGFSVQLAVRKQYMNFCSMLLRVAYPSKVSKRHPMWTSERFQHLLSSVLKQWIRHYRSLHSKITLPTDIPHLSTIQQLSFHHPPSPRKAD